jgi:hypothetical protein
MRLLIKISGMESQKYSLCFQKQVSHADASRSLNEVGETIRQFILACGKNPANFGLACPPTKAPTPPMTNTPRHVEDRCSDSYLPGGVPGDRKFLFFLIKTDSSENPS